MEIIQKLKCSPNHNRLGIMFQLLDWPPNHNRLGVMFQLLKWSLHHIIGGIKGLMVYQQTHLGVMLLLSLGLHCILCLFQIQSLPPLEYLGKACCTLP